MWAKTCAKSADDMQALWQRLRDRGQVGAGYWAVMSLKQTPTSLKTQAFAEVHMLSHLHGHGASQLATRLSEVERHSSDLEACLRRSETIEFHAGCRRAVPSPAPSGQWILYIGGRTAVVPYANCEP